MPSYTLDTHTIKVKGRIEAEGAEKDVCAYKTGREDWRKMHNEELCYFYSSLIIIQVVQ
jgi:hypothetical protein